MGIIYHCVIRCFKVKNVEEVDLTVVSDEDKSQKEYLTKYFQKAKANVVEKLAEYKHHPGFKNGHKILNLKVPKQSNMIAFSNSACDQYGGSFYFVHFFDQERKLIETKYVDHEKEKNNFMLLVPENTYSIDYEINDYGATADHDFNFGKRCQSC